MSLAKSRTSLLFDFPKSLFCGFDVELPGGVGNVRDLGIGWFCRALRKGGRGQQAQRRKSGA
jgi:hypothetical protein